MLLEERQQRLHEVLSMREDGATWKAIQDRYGYSSPDAARMHFNRMNSKLLKHLEERGIDPADVRMVWDKTKEYSVKTVYDNTYTPEEAMAKFRRACTAEFGKLNMRKPKKPRGNLLVVDPADMHIGKLASFDSGKYNIEIAIACAREGIQGIIDHSAPYNIQQVVLVIGNDVLHTDNPRRTTTSGTPQDTDGMWWDAVSAAQRLYVETIGWLKEIAPVHVIYNPSNHDYMMGAMLAQYTHAWFNADKAVTFDVSMEHRKYFKWGNTLIGTSHGDGAKMQDLPLLMASEAKEKWAGTDYRYWLLGHIHHKKEVKWLSSEDFIGCSVRYLRTISQSDRWHKDNGYTLNKRALEGFVYSDKHGEVCQLSYNF